MNFFERGGFLGRNAPAFQQDYRVFTVQAAGRPELELGDKIILPESALRALTVQRVAYPMLFQLKNRQTGRSTHCSVMEFSADEGVCYIPLWMMEHLGLYDSAVLNVMNVSLQKAQYVKIQPHKTAFTEISNPKAVLEHRLRNYSCLTTGDTLCIEYNSEKFYIDVLEVRPDGKACIIETDCEVDFAAPLDYKEPEREPAAPKKVSRVDSPGGGASPAVGAGGGSEAAGGASKGAAGGSAAAGDGAAEEAAEEEEEEVPQFFQSGGYRIDGKPSKTSPAKPKPKQKSPAELKKEVCVRACVRACVCGPAYVSGAGHCASAQARGFTQAFLCCVHRKRKKLRTVNDLMRPAKQLLKSELFGLDPS